MREDTLRSPPGPEPVPQHRGLSFMGANGRGDRLGVAPLKGRFSTLGQGVGPLEC